MKNAVSVYIFLLLLPVFACSDTSTGPGNGGTNEPSVTATIGIVGGMVSDDTLSLVVPAGAFDDEELVSLTNIEDETFDTALSDTYLIEGLPMSFAEDITISFTVADAPEDSIYIAVGTESWAYDTGDVDTAYRYFPATVTESEVTTIIPATAAIGAARSAFMHASQTVSAKATVVSGVATHTTAQNHFTIEYFTKYDTIDNIRYVGECLEEAYSTFQHMGFSYERHSLWPITVSVRAISSTVDGKYENTLMGHLGGGIITLNSLSLDDADQMKVTIGHEFFHFIQSLYDPRNWISRAKSTDVPQLWLDEAMSVWSEEKFTDETVYVSDARTGNENAPFTGVIEGALIDAEAQGYGLSGMIKYLADTYGEQKLVTTYEHLYSGDHPLTALKKATEDPVVWWEAFMRKYFEGDIYDLNATPMINSNNGLFNITTKKDTLKTFSDTYPDLSAKVYVVNLAYDDIDENATLEFSVTGDFTDIAVYQYMNNPYELTRLDTSSESVTVPDLKQLTENGHKLVALVTNCANTEPYDSSTPITLKMHVKIPKTTIHLSHLNHAFISIGDINGVYSGSGEQPSGFSYSAPGSATGENTFAAHRETTPAGYSMITNISITIDQTREMVTNFEADFERRNWENQVVEQTALVGFDIPMTANWTNLGSDIDYVRFRLEGSSIKSHVSIISYFREGLLLTDYNPDADSYIAIEIDVDN